MRDSRLQQIVDLLDDADRLISEIVGEGPMTSRTPRDFNSLYASRMFIQSAVSHVQCANDDNREGLANADGRWDTWAGDGVGP